MSLLPAMGKQHLCGLPLSTDLAFNVRVLLHIVLLYIHLKKTYKQKFFTSCFLKDNSPPLFFFCKDVL